MLSNFYTLSSIQGAAASLAPWGWGWRRLPRALPWADLIC
jgi:hypothetical protein